jgi:GNAT superfamily N-acetyltransferase
MVANMPNRKLNLDEIQSRLEYADCIGAYVGDALAGYTWARYDRVAMSRGRIKLHQLASDEAYLFDMYVDKDFRGMALAPLLRHRLYVHLSGKGVQHFYSITAYFNRSSRKFKAKLGAREFELRIAVRLWSFLNADFLLRRYQGGNPMGTKRAYFVKEA